MFLRSHRRNKDGKDHQGVQFRGSDDPVLYVSNPPGIDSLAKEPEHVLKMYGGEFGRTPMVKRRARPST